jgi:hypothetical protein
VLEPEVPGQDLGAGNFYTHLNYWLLDGEGAALAHREIGVIAPTTYPGGAGTERTYFDVVPAGRNFFLAYFSESESGPPLSIYYKILDRDGNEVREERPAFAGTVAAGPVLASNGRTIGLTGLKSVTLDGNYMYMRCFDTAGDPRGPETQYGDKLGFGPTIFWAGDKFLTAYCVFFDPISLGYALMFAPFNEYALPLGAEYPLADSEGTPVLGTMQFAVDLQLVGDGNTLLGKAQTSDVWYITIAPQVFALSGDGTVDERDLFDLAARWHNPFTTGDLAALLARRRR